MGGTCDEVAFLRESVGDDGYTGSACATRANAFTNESLEYIKHHDQELDRG